MKTYTPRRASRRWLKNMLMALAMGISSSGWAQTLPEAPKRQQTAFYALSGVTFGMGVADAHTTRTNLTQWGMREGNPLLGDHPSAARTYGTIAAANAVAVAGAWQLKRKGKRYWYVPMLASIAINAWGIERNLNGRYDSSVRCTQWSDGRRECR